jgi:hypothetical protein
MRNYKTEDGKQIVHSTQLSLYQVCPKARQLSELFESERSEAMRTGLLVEAYLWRFKEDNQKELEGRKKAETLNDLKRYAEMLKPYFPDNGESFKKVSVENELFACDVEYDYYFNDHIYDLKTTSTIANWNNLERENLIQPLFYAWVHNEYFGTIPQFSYVIFPLDTEIIKVINIEISAKDLDWIESKIMEMVTDPFMEANLGEHCLKGKYGQCNYLLNCEDAKNALAETKTIIVNQL